MYSAGPASGINGLIGNDVFMPKTAKTAKRRQHI